MRKSLAFMMALLLALGCMAAAGGTPSGTLGPGNSAGTVTVTYTVQSTYLITIPEDMAIPYGEESTKIGDIGLQPGSALDNGYHVLFTVEGVAADGAGAMVNADDNALTLAYYMKIYDVYCNSAGFTGVGTYPVYVDIDGATWDAAQPGTYRQTLTFTISYEQIP